MTLPLNHSTEYRALIAAQLRGQAMANEKTLAALKDAKTVARNRYAWPGGYAMFLVMTDGGCLCSDCVKAEWKNIAHSTIGGYRDGWQAAAADCMANVDSEDPVICDHCGKDISGS